MKIPWMGIFPSARGSAGVFQVCVLSGLMALMLLGGRGMAWAQVAATNIEVEGIPASLDVSEELANARATMTTFLEAFYDPQGADLDTAATCLDLGRLPLSVRAGRGREMAAQLKAILDRVELIDIELINLDPNGPPWVLEVVGAGEVVLSKSADGRWLFSQRTLENLGRMLTAVEDREIVEGVGQTVGAVSVSQRLRQRMPPSLRQERCPSKGGSGSGLYC